MILNAIDKVLFRQDLDRLIQKIRELVKTYYPHDIDFRCAKTADGLGRHYGVSALGICCSLWARMLELQALPGKVLLSKKKQGKRGEI